MRLRTLLAGAAVALGATAASLPGAISGPVDLLPDLDQRAPYDVGVVRAGSARSPRFRLAFASAVDNRGAGVLIVDGSRANVSVPQMTASQVIERSDGSARVVPEVGVLRYVRSPDHAHWHLLGFERYELRRAGDFSLAVRDRKTGFCLGDRYGFELTGRGEPRFQTRCGLNGTRLLRLREGITPGYGDDYKANLEAQYLDVTGLGGGRYVLVHRANPGRRVVESDYSNNAASLVVELSWPRGPKQRPTVTELARCPGTERCEAA